MSIESNDKPADKPVEIEKATEGSTEIKTSSVNVNEHKQNETFVDKDHDTIEDYSKDKDLEAAEHKEKKEGEAEKAPVAGLGNLFAEA